MNTKNARKIAIAKQLGEIIEHACKYSPEDRIEPDEGALYQFCDEIARFAKLNYRNSLGIREVGNLIEFCYHIGRNVGHVFSNGSTTGTWGVRISNLENLIKILSLPEFELIPRGDNFYLNDQLTKILDYHVESGWLVVKYKTMNEYAHEWEGVVYWQDLENYKKEN